MSLKARPQDVADGRMGAAGTGGGMGSPETDRILREFNQFNTEAARAAFADKWVRLTSRKMNSMWRVFYELLRIIRDRKLYENPSYMADRQTYATFEDYWDKVVQKPFTTWIELEQVHHFVQEHAPNLLAGPLSEAKRALGNHGGARVGAGRRPKEEADPDVASLPLMAMSQGNPRRKGNQVDNVNLKTSGGNSANYLTARIARDRPDILDRMKAGEFPSVRKAAIEAGIVQPTITLPIDPVAATRLIVKHFKGEALTELVRGLANWAGLELVDAHTPTPEV